MLEVKNLTKIYSGKGGVTVKALDNVSVSFPETGMVFLLGKSGSGKSTLLNVIGGLDKPDQGEVIVKGKSSRDFSGSDFDSYRNTFIGFVFQEYNILNEFTIEQNIALALQLQSKPNDRKAVAALLEQVDLAGYAKRKPNTLSGGQKQRVAIARALIKEPEIIMADEPTGALDSNTGRQVLETLKRLSEKKLVIVVSHDREFAEEYGDRIIELKDGRIISDVSKVYYTPSTLSIGKGPIDPEEENVSLISETTIAIKDGETLSDEEVRRIGELLRAQKGEIIITSDPGDMPAVKRACKINENGSKESFRETGPVEVKQYDGKKTRFIKSHLPLGHAIKMGASGLKSKPFRLIFTILLAVAAFILFGVASTFMLYDPNYSVSAAMKEANYPAVAISKTYSMKITNYQVDESGEKEYDYDWTNELTTRFGASEVASRSKDGLDFAGVFNFTDNTYESSEHTDLRLVDGRNYITPDLTSTTQDYYVITGAVGFSDCGADYLARHGFSLIKGRYPTDGTGVALPAYLAELFLDREDSDGKKIEKVEDLVDRKIKFSNNALQEDTFTITGIYDVGEIPAKYAALKAPIGSATHVNDKEKEPLKASFKDYLTNSFHLVVFVTEAFYTEHEENISKSGGYTISIQQENYKNIMFSNYKIEGEYDVSNNQYSVYTDKTMRLYGESIFSFYDNDGKATTFDDQANGVYISYQYYKSKKSDALNQFLWRLTGRINISPAAKTEYNSEEFNKKQNGKDNGYNAKYDFITEWQSDVLQKYYLFKATEFLINKGDPYMSGDFYDAYQVISNYYYYYGDDENAPTVPTEATWNTVRSVVESDLSENVRYYCILNMLQDLGLGDIPFMKDDYSVYYGLMEDTLSTEETAAAKAEIDRYMVENGIAPLSATKPFDFLPSALQIGSIYYLDKNNVSGSFPVLGYFTNGLEWGADFFFSQSLLSAHAVYVPFEWGYQVSESETDYVVPADAKYNYLLSPTDNSQEQIAAVRSTSKGTEINIKSNVYAELQMFLNLIKSLEKIFLYIGLGVGLLAAFFLLNFISVSISAKKKDIGILRAVGARGSDVFKIFYAEAFIIAAICFILASVGSYVLCFFLNRTMVEAVSLKLLDFGPINIALVLGISVFVSVIATFFPVYFAARKSPVEAIRAL